MNPDDPSKPTPNDATTVSKQPAQPPNTNGHAPAPSSSPTWRSFFPPGGVFDASRGVYSLLIGRPDAHTALLNISADAHPFVQLVLRVEDCKSLHDHLRATAADYRAVRTTEPQPAFFFRFGNPAAPAVSLQARTAYMLNVVVLSGGETFTAQLPLPLESAEALAHDLARTIARLECRTPLP